MFEEALSVPGGGFRSQNDLISSSFKSFPDFLFTIPINMGGINEVYSQIQDFSDQFYPIPLCQPHNRNTSHSDLSYPKITLSQTHLAHFFSPKGSVLRLSTEGVLLFFKVYFILGVNQEDARCVWRKSASGHTSKSPSLTNFRDHAIFRMGVMPLDQRVLRESP